MMLGYQHASIPPSRNDSKGVIRPGVLSSASHGHHQHSDPFSWTTPRGPAAGGVLDLHPPSAGAAPALASELRSSEAPPVTEYVINEHQHAVLTCDVPPELLNLVQIFWYHDNVPTETVVLGQLKAGSNGGEPDAGRRYVRDPSTGSLTISGARMEDDGVWGCQAKEATSRRVLHSGPAVRLVILVPPRPPYLLLDGRRLDPTNLFVPMREHGTLDVECVVEAGNPAPTVTWQMLLAERLLPRLDEAVDDLVSTVAVDKPTGLGGHLSSQARVQHIVREHHNATVSCLVSHPTLAVPYNATILLDVQPRPSGQVWLEHLRLLLALLAGLPPTPAEALLANTSGGHHQGGWGAFGPTMAGVPSPVYLNYSGDVMLGAMIPIHRRGPSGSDCGPIQVKDGVVEVGQREVGKRREQCELTASADLDSDARILTTVPFRITDVLGKVNMQSAETETASEYLLRKTVFSPIGAIEWHDCIPSIASADSKRTVKNSISLATSSLVTHKVLIPVTLVWHQSYNLRALVIWVPGWVCCKLYRVASLLILPPMPSQADFPWDVAKKFHSAGTPKSFSW
ncbi:hypothetical protein FOCC_FOCC005035 [Frankliniella occidentalis]|nr:hypothetical protein FOCC_FOCC005035 [Frankliniella occidentalis]